MGLIEQPVQAFAVPAKANLEGRVEGLRDAAKHADRDTVDPTKLDPRDLGCGNTCLRPDIHLSPPPVQPKRAERVTESDGIHHPRMARLAYRGLIPGTVVTAARTNHSGRYDASHF